MANDTKVKSSEAKAKKVKSKETTKFVGQNGELHIVRRTIAPDNVQTYVVHTRIGDELTSKGKRKKIRQKGASELHKNVEAAQAAIDKISAQAIKMGKWSATHGASPAVIRFSERVVTGQTDEIGLMQSWLRDRRQPVPDPDPAGMKMIMGGTEHVMLMPGMLTPEQMAKLDAARDKEFDRLFLTFMIQHHEGAITMVRELFSAPGAAQDEFVFKFANDVEVDQSTEIARMKQMMLEL